MNLRTAVTGLVALAAHVACAHQAQEPTMRAEASPTTLEEVRQFALGRWQSLAVELRPAEDRTGGGKVTPTRLTRQFEYLPGDQFVGRIRLFGDDVGQLPLMEFEFRGHLEWGPPHPIARGAWSVDYVLDQGFGVTPLHAQAATMLNQAPVAGLAPFEVGVQQDILKKAFPLFDVVEGQIVRDYDLIYFHGGLLFMGAKHVDGTPFDRPERRPHQLQIPLARSP